MFLALVLEHPVYYPHNIKAQFEKNCVKRFGKICERYLMYIEQFELIYLHNKKKTRSVKNAQKINKTYKNLAFKNSVRYHYIMTCQDYFIVM